MKRQKNPDLQTPSLFRLWDVAVYFFVIALVALLFVFFVFTPSKVQSQGFKIVLDGIEIAQYDYTTQTLSVKDEYKPYVGVDGNNITVYSNQSKTHYNVLNVNVQNKSVKVVNANCSASKECVYTPAVKGDNGAIVCAPHKLKIVPLSNNGLVPPQTGGA